MIKPLTNKRRAAYTKFARLLNSRRKRKQPKGRPTLPQPGSIPTNKSNLSSLNQGQYSGLMNNGGEYNLPPIQGNPWSPTGGNGMDNLNNMIKRNRPTYY